MQKSNECSRLVENCHVAISGSALLLTAATFERFLTIYKYRPMFFELDVVPNENCTGVTAYRPEMKEWTYEEPYKTVYKFWFRSIVNTFFPFFLSFYFNIRIISRLNQQHAAARLFRFATSEHRKNIRSATNMLVMVTACYIACNSLNVVVTAWEFVDIDSLLTQEIRPFYTYSSDLVSLLTVFASAVRLPIYYACNARIRREVNAYLLRFCRCDRTSSEFSRDNASLATVRYMNSGNGYVIYKAQKERKNGLSEAKFVVGTGFDKIVLQVAMRGWNRTSNLRTSIQRSCTPKDFV
uniref:G-protein coupled receptors family 1 profile domain-containing protein n=1 Tax=Ditylenchus dipsaci TaxID=166011 RepID=A0A915DHS7_9BILA